MKYLALAVILLLACSTLQQTTPTPPAPPAPSCSTSEGANKIALAWIKSKGIEILSNPDKLVGNTMCGGEFATKGTCCKVDKLVEYISKSNDIMANKWRNFIGKISRVKGKFLKGLKQMQSKMNVKDFANKLNILKTNDAVAKKYAEVLQVIPTDAAQLAQSKMWIENFDKNLEEFKTQGRACFEILKKARANFFCAACSFDAGAYSQT